ncbi:MAG: hypothetical protein M1827_003177 [Pycnora praestabilis]|nr:MAG: hypothetical protein M1827_003177 [Pycnora praestabilis]
MDPQAPPTAAQACDCEVVKALVVAAFDEFRAEESGSEHWEGYAYVVPQDDRKVV